VIELYVDAAYLMYVKRGSHIPFVIVILVIIAKKGMSKTSSAPVLPQRGVVQLWLDGQ